MTRQWETLSAWAGGSRSLLADVAGLGALAFASLLTGVLLNASRQQPLPLVYRSGEDRLHSAVASLMNGEASTLTTPSGERAREIGLDELQALVAARNGIVIDARAAVFYREGHVSGALNLPRGDFEAAYRRLDARLSVHKSDTLTVYCSSADCHDAALVAEALRTLGYQRTNVYVEGWEEWSQSGLPQEK